MRTAILMALCASLAIACTDQVPNGNDGGMDVQTVDVAPPDSGADGEAGPHTCIFDKDNFDNGCVFGP